MAKREVLETTGKQISTAETLQLLGYRLTPQRIMVLSTLEAARDHISAEEIYAQVRQRYPHIPISTVYRVLELLEKLNLVTKTDMGEGRVRYHLEEVSRHHHLICKGCGAITQMEASLLANLETVLKERYGFQASLHHFAIFGYCKQCRKKEEDHAHP